MPVMQVFSGRVLCGPRPNLLLKFILYPIPGSNLFLHTRSILSTRQKGGWRSAEIEYYAWCYIYGKLAFSIACNHVVFATESQNIASIALNTTFGFFQTPLWPICKISTGLSDKNTPLSWFPLCREGYSKSITSTRFWAQPYRVIFGDFSPLDYTFNVTRMKWVLFAVEDRVVAFWCRSW